jgi:hypothetical protein
MERGVEREDVWSEFELELMVSTSPLKPTAGLSGPPVQLIAPTSFIVPLLAKDARNGAPSIWRYGEVGHPPHHANSLLGAGFEDTLEKNVR